MTTSIKYEVEQLYHYTSLNTLHAILQNKTIRLTDYRFLNDMQELFFATEKLKKYIQGNPTINEREELLTAVQNIESGKISTIYYNTAFFRKIKRLHMNRNIELHCHLNLNISTIHARGNL